MGHAGTTLDLGQPNVASPNKPAGFWPVIVALTAVAMVLATLYVVGSTPAKGPAAANLTEDRSYDQIEAQRGTVTFTVSEDRGYDAIEAHRGGATFAVPQGASNDAIEAHRAWANRMVGAPAGAANITISAGPSNDAIEAHRAWADRMAP